MEINLTVQNVRFQLGVAGLGLIHTETKWYEIMNDFVRTLGDMKKSHKYY